MKKYLVLEYLKRIFIDDTFTRESQKFWNILVCASLQHVYHVIERRRCPWCSRLGGVCGVVVIVVGNGHGDTSSNPGRD